jgi:N-acetylmuramoyl-L-alanine amidase
VPFRAVGEALGATVDYMDSENKVTYTKKRVGYSTSYDVVQLTIGSQTMFVNGKQEQLDVAPRIENGRTLVPFRNVGEAFDADVEYVPEGQKVYYRKRRD